MTTQPQTRAELARRDLSIARRVKRFIVAGLKDCTALLAYDRQADTYYLSIMQNGRYTYHLAGDHHTVGMSLSQLYVLTELPHHTTDTDCILDTTETCTVCHVYHGDPCPVCNGRGFHNPNCTEEN